MEWRELKLRRLPVSRVFRQRRSAIKGHGLVVFHQSQRRTIPFVNLIGREFEGSEKKPNLFLLKVTVRQPPHVARHSPISANYTRRPANDKAQNMIWIKTWVFSKTLSRWNVRHIVRAQIPLLGRIMFCAELSNTSRFHLNARKFLSNQAAEVSLPAAFPGNHNEKRYLSAI